MRSRRAPENFKPPRTRRDLKNLACFRPAPADFTSLAPQAPPTRTRPALLPSRICISHGKLLLKALFMPCPSRTKFNACPPRKCGYPQSCAGLTHPAQDCVRPSDSQPEPTLLLGGRKFAQGRNWKRRMVRFHFLVAHVLILLEILLSSFRSTT